jgi:hypothetical protein
LRTDQTLACWGSNYGFYSAETEDRDSVYYGQATPPPGEFTQVSAGPWHACGVTTSGTVLCWGNNASGQATPPVGTFTQVSSGGTFRWWPIASHTCGLTTDGTVSCWGDNSSGQATPPPGQFTQVSTGGSHTCGLKGDGTAVCWGASNAGQATPPPVAFTEVSAGESHTCALEVNASVACWGSRAVAETEDEPAVASQLVFAVQPSNTAPLITIQPPVQVMAVDAEGNRVASFTGLVTVAIGRNGGLLLPGRLSGTTTVAAVGGYATFSDLSIDQPGTGYTLVVTSAALTRAESASFNVLLPSLGAGVRVTGGSAIGPGAPIPGSDRQEFVFDVTNAPTGRLVVRDYTFVRSNGTVASLTVDPLLDTATGISSFTQTSPACVTFGGRGRVDTGEVVAFTVDACDHGTPGAGMDSFGLTVPSFNYRKSGTLTEGEIALTTL